MHTSMTSARGRHAAGASYPTRRSLREAQSQPEAPTTHNGALNARQTLSTAPSIRSTPTPLFPQRTEEPTRPPITVRSCARRIGAIAGIAALALTFAVAGVISPHSDAPAASLSGQHLGTGLAASTDVDLLTEIATESTGNTLSTFHNYPDAKVQYPFASPVPLTDGFGERLFPVSGFHDAQDFAASLGTPVQAIADGLVHASGWTSDGCGYGVTLHHEIDGAHVSSRYCHLWEGSQLPSEGDDVAVGQEIGQVGATGIAFGAHLHFVITIDEVAIDPMPFLREHNRTTRGK